MNPTLPSFLLHACDSAASSPSEAAADDAVRLERLDPRERCVLLSAHFSGAVAGSLQTGAASWLPAQRVLSTEQAAAMARGPRLWLDLYHRAQHLTQQEPLLAGVVQRLILSWERPVDALAAVLANRLSSADWSVRALQSLFAEFLVRESTLSGPTHPASSGACGAYASWIPSEPTPAQDQPHGIGKAWRLFDLASLDLAAILSRDPSMDSPLSALLNLKGFHALQIQRITHALWLDGRKELALSLSNAVSAQLSVDIHPGAQLGYGLLLDHATGLVIGETAVVGNDVSFLHNVTLGGTGKEQGDRHPKVCDGVLFGTGATVLGNIEVGAFSKVAAGSVVLAPVPAHATVAGVPARIVRRLNPERVPGIEMRQTL